MTLFLGLLLLFFQQAPTGRVIVGLLDQQQIAVDNPRFSGFIETRGDDTVLMYRQGRVHGELFLKSIARVDFAEYRRAGPLEMTVTLKTGQKLQVQSDRIDGLTVRGTTDSGTVTIKHPDPLSTPLELTTRKPSRERDLTISYLEFP
jgi:hypothetical protein